MKLFDSFHRQWAAAWRIFCCQRWSRSKHWAPDTVQCFIKRQTSNSWWVKAMTSKQIKRLFASTEHTKLTIFNFFSPADDIRFIVMNENSKRVLWRCSLMSTKTRKCPARVTMYKDNPPRFVMGQCRHEHMELVRGMWKLILLRANSFGWDDLEIEIMQSCKKYKHKMRQT